MLFRSEFTMDFFHMLGFASTLQALSQQRQDFAGDTPTLTGILVQHHIVKHIANDASLLANVFIASVASSGMRRPSANCRPCVMDG